MNLHQEFNTESTSLFAKLLVMILVAFLVSIEEAQAEPFVAGFDRFGLHQEIDEQLASDLLITELNCTACHQGEQTALAPKGAPDLTGAGTRFSKTWLKNYLLAPDKLKPGSTMPDVLHGYSTEKKTEVAAALAEFLSTQEQPFPVLKANGLIPVQHEFWLKGNVENGGKLYHSAGCVACHAPDKEYETENNQASSLDKLLDDLDPEELAELGLSGKARTVKSIPHGDLHQKYTLLSLSHFIHNPERTRSAGRMPNLKLIPFEAADIAAYLLRDQKPNADGSASPVNTKLVATGKKYFVELGCANCHQLKGLSPTSSLQRKSLATLNFAAKNSCVQNPKPTQPAYRLSDQQQQFLKKSSILQGGDGIELTDSHQLRLLQLNCFACHERDDRGGVGRKRQQYFETVGHVDIGDEGRLPPALTHVGKKLTPGWFAKVFAGKGDIRSHMTIRMPIFPKSLVKELPQQLAIADSASSASEKDVFGDISKLAQPGRELLNTGCIQCHPLRGESLASVVGTDLNGVHQRVRPAWFKEFLLNPIALKNRTRMPTFFPNGVSSNPAILSGDVDQQVAAIWAYLKENQKHALPEKILAARSKNFELIPTDKPIVLRTFMDKAGTHAIAVGFPEKVNIAFDSENCRLVEAWKGRFLDAHGTWYNRFTPLAEPLGTDRIEFPHFVGIIGNATGGDISDQQREELKQLSKLHFQGYQLDKRGIPTFKYSVADRLIEEQFQPGEYGEIIRKITMSSSVKGTVVESPGISFCFLDGKTIKKNENNSYENDYGLIVSFPSGRPVNLVIANLPDKKRCMAFIPNQEQVIIEVVYKW